VAEENVAAGVTLVAISVGALDLTGTSGAGVLGSGGGVIDNEPLSSERWDFCVKCWCFFLEFRDMAYTTNQFFDFILCGLVENLISGKKGLGSFTVLGIFRFCREQNFLSIFLKNMFENLF